METAPRGAAAGHVITGETCAVYGMGLQAAAAPVHDTLPSSPLHCWDQIGTILDRY